MVGQAKRSWRRFFRFKISTWFVLVGIVAWGMALQPYVLVFHEGINPFPGVATSVSQDMTHIIIWTAVASGGSVVESGQWEIFFRTRAYLWPGLALAAFLAWKGFWLILARRREKAATN